MTPKQYTNLLKRYIEDNFATQKEAAEFFGCSQTTVTLTLMGERTPQPAMYEATGHRYKETITKQYFKI